MKINNIKAADYKHQDGVLVLTLAETTLEDITNMDTSLVSVQTDAGDFVEVFAAYTLRSVTYDLTGGFFTAVLTPTAEDTTAASLEALAGRLAAQETTQEDIMLALAELAGLMTASAGGGMQ